MKIYKSRVTIELSASEISGLLIELKTLGKYNYINELQKDFPNLYKLAANLPALELPSEMGEF
jgi:hypothetical protein